MNTLLKTALITGLFATLNANATTLAFPDTIKVTGVNGEHNGHSQMVDLQQGQQLIEIQYHDIFAANADDSGAWVKSDPLYLLVKFADEGDYQLELPQIYSEDDAYDFLEQPMLTLRNAQGQGEQVTLMTHHQLMAQLLFAKQ
ncbi:DUF2057 family protein [Shewanella waksmanii]|uniref:DUF2057 family protein n=1 Tax=Shewanella waksmanii TaxID=213783 RepID=UPI00048C03DF|nr:DUF2057 family protein [Shewanella waksmanii]